ncbi:TIGR02117 family protein [Flavobacterium silvaticum]|uniref:TIGR02117 family protein n=1 Tax=Flavobacterium silvaticum TaxID=1852020 RepID=A0A972FRV4_9FLAO|nr:TIGR02117 family protein [Flavobacterium silvaticum]NMH26857.1 TIGR02117 family protein [Flavobacterium silvaticum]
MKRFLKITGIIIGAVVSAILMYLIMAFCLSRIPVNTDAVDSKDISIYILTNGVHTDIVVPVKTDDMDWSKLVPFKNTVATDSTANWLAMGWGDKGFYLETPTWDDLKASTAFKAAFGLSTTAMHCTYYKSLSESKSCHKIGITKQQYQKLTAYILDSFRKGPDQLPIYIKTNANYGNHDAFYEGVGTYSLFETCNTWANASLKSCERKACLWTAFDTGIFKLYE